MKTSSFLRFITGTLFFISPFADTVTAQTNYSLTLNTNHTWDTAPWSPSGTLGTGDTITDITSDSGTVRSLYLESNRQVENLTIAGLSGTGGLRIVNSNAGAAAPDVTLNIADTFTLARSARILSQNASARLTVNTNALVIDGGVRFEIAVNAGQEYVTLAVAGTTTLKGGNSAFLLQSYATSATEVDLGDVVFKGTLSGGSPGIDIRSHELRVRSLEGNSGKGSIQSSNNGTGKLIIYGNNSASYAFDSLIGGAPNARNIRIEKTGNNIQILNSEYNTYSGGTLISGGVLAANNTDTGSSGLGTGSVTVSNGGILAGRGSLVLGAGNHTTVQAGGTIAPGADGQTGFSNLIFNNYNNRENHGALLLEMKEGSAFTFRVDENGDSDHIIFGYYEEGSVLFEGGAITLNVTGTLSEGKTYQLFSFKSDGATGGHSTSSGLIEGLVAGTGFEGYLVTFHYDEEGYGGVGCISMTVEAIPTPLVYVAPSGNDSSGNGNRNAPLATVAAAISKLQSTGGTGSVILRGGVYHEKIKLPNTTDEVPPLWIIANSGERVVFEGGTKITQWQEDPKYPGLYVIHAPGRKTMLSQTNYFEVWENTERVRYRKVADPAGVQAWPGSVCLLDDDRLLVHVRNGRTPATADLWHNQEAEGASIANSNTTLFGLTFQNYLGGGEARALTVSLGRNIRVLECSFINSTIGISNTAHETLIEDCLFFEAGMGIRHAGTGTDMTARRCVLESAVGLFAFSDLGEHLRNGIRIYHSGDGATVEQCVTAGFWAGLYIKTITHRDGSRPVYVRNNTFIDTLRVGADHLQPRTFIERNIIGPYVENSGVGPNGSYMRSMGATLEENYYFDHPGEADGSDSNGIEPFIDLVAGDLRLRNGLSLPAAENELGATHISKVYWNERLATTLLPSEEDTTPLAITRSPVATASQKGALISIAFSRQTTPKLFYRAIGETIWKTQAALPNQVVRPLKMAASAPVDPEVIDSWGYLFVLLDDTLAPEQTYEFQIKTNTGIETSISTFSTVGEAKNIHVAAGEQIQDALDRALPGDTVLIAPGVYTEPLLLQHGGTPDAPLIIRGSGMYETILDGGKQVGTMIALKNAAHVHLSEMQVRWFGNIGVHVVDSPNGKANTLWIWNQSLFPRASGISGQGLYLIGSPGWDVTNSIFNRVERGVLAVRSPQICCKNNTAFGCLYSGISLLNSALDSTITYNTLNFTGNVSYRIEEQDTAAFDSLVSDYNNFGSLLRVATEIDQGGTVRYVEGIRPENDFIPAEHYGGVTESKFIIETWIGTGSEIFLRMGDWRTFSGKDMNSIFDDPLFVDPVKGDFRLLPATPNQLENQQIIGAENIQ